MGIEATHHYGIFSRLFLHARNATRPLMPGEIVDFGIVDRTNEGESHHILVVDAEGDTAKRGITCHIPQGVPLTSDIPICDQEPSLDSDGENYTDRGCLGLITGSRIVYSYV